MVQEFTVGDFDGDGFDDLAFSGGSFFSGFTVRWGSPNQLTAQVGNIQGERRAGGGGLVGLNLNGDGYDDIVVQVRGRCLPFVSLGAERGFRVGPEVFCDGRFPLRADLNGDSFDDAYLPANDGRGSPRVVYSDGQGNLLRPDPPWIAAPYATFSTAASGDVDGDGRIDMLLAGLGVDTFRYPKALNRSMAVARGLGAGVFELVDEGRGTWLGGWPYGIAAADFDRDGRDDAVVSVGGRLEIYRGIDGPGFESRPMFSTILEHTIPGLTVSSFTIADFNGDGLLDVVTNPFGRRAEERLHGVFRGDGAGGLTLDHVLRLEGRRNGFSWPVQAGDFNGDGRMDLATLERYDDGAGSLRVDAVVLESSCPLAVSIDSGEAPALPGETSESRVTVRNISRDSTVRDVVVRELRDIFFRVQSATRDDGTACPDNDGIECDLGALAPGAERAVTLEQQAVEFLGDVIYPPDAPETAEVQWDGGDARARKIRRLNVGVDLTIELETPAFVEPGVESTARVTTRNVGSEAATNVRVGLSYRYPGIRQGGVCLDQCLFSTLGSGEVRISTFGVLLPEGQAGGLSFDASASSDEVDLSAADNEATGQSAVPQSTPQPLNPGFSRPILEHWEADPLIRYERFGPSLRVYDTGAIRQTVEGLVPGAAYSLRVEVSADRRAEARIAVRATDRDGGFLSAVSLRPLAGYELLQLTFRAPSDGAVRIELFGEVNREEVENGEMAGVGWRFVEIRESDPKALLVPEQYPTIQAAVDASSDGDLILIGPGVYREVVDVGDRAVMLEATEGFHNTIVDAGRNGDGITFSDESPKGAEVRGLTVRNAHIAVRAGGSSLIHGCRLSDSAVGAMLTSSASLRNSVVEFNGQQGVLAQGGSEIVGNRIRHNGTQRSTSAVRIERSSDQLRFEANIVSDNRSGVLILGGGSVHRNRIVRNEGPALQAGGAADIQSNLIASAEASNFGLVSLDQSGSFERPRRFAGNTVVGAEGASGPLVEIVGDAERMDFRNNVLQATTSGAAIVCADDSTPPGAPNLVWNREGPAVSGCGPELAGAVVAADPGFRDASAGDYAPADRSPMVDAGAPGPGLLRDLRGKPRVRDGDGDGEERIDLGAYERQPLVRPARGRRPSR